MTMVRVAVCVCAVVLGFTAIAGAATVPLEEHALTIRIYDYSDTEPAILEKAQQQATQTFSDIGVKLTWRQPIRPKRIAAGLEPWPSDGDAFITITVQSREMAERRRIGRNVAGYAVIEPNAVGRVAFLIADRIQQIARVGRADPGRVFGLVMAHELTHLLLGDRSHSTVGVMRPDWAAADFRQSAGNFDARQRDEIRRAIGRLKMSQAQVAD